MHAYGQAQNGKPPAKVPEVEARSGNKQHQKADLDKEQDDNKDTLPEYNPEPAVF
jgi:hypothetical protein